MTCCLLQINIVRIFFSEQKFFMPRHKMAEGHIESYLSVFVCVQAITEHDGI